MRPIPVSLLDARILTAIITTSYSYLSTFGLLMKRKNLIHDSRNLLLPQREREEEKMEHRQKVVKWEPPKTEWDSVVSVLGAFKLDHFQSVKLFVFQQISTFLTFILEAPISYYPRLPERGREEAARAEHGKMGTTQKWMRHSGFFTYGIQIGPFPAC